MYRVANKMSQKVSLLQIIAENLNVNIVRIRSLESLATICN